MTQNSFELTIKRKKETNNEQKTWSNPMIKKGQDVVSTREKTTNKRKTRASTQLCEK